MKLLSAADICTPSACVCAPVRVRSRVCAVRVRARAYLCPCDLDLLVVLELFGHQPLQLEGLEHHLLVDLKVPLLLLEYR